MARSRNLFIICLARINRLIPFPAKKFSVSDDEKLEPSKISRKSWKMMKRFSGSKFFCAFVARKWVISWNSNHSKPPELALCRRTKTGNAVSRNRKKPENFEFENKNGDIPASLLATERFKWSLNNCLEMKKEVCCAVKEWKREWVCVRACVREWQRERERVKSSESESE